MGKLKNIVLPVVISLFLIPLSLSFAQEDEVMPYGTEEDDSVIYETEPVDEDVVLYDTQTDDVLYDEYPPVDEPVITAGLAAVSIAVWFTCIIFGLAGYIFSAVAMYKIGKDMGYQNSWFAWIPILNSIMVFQLGKQNPNFLFLLLIPGIGALIVSIFSLIALMNITEKRGYDKLLGLLILTGVGTFILLYLLAWKPRTDESNQPVYAAQTPTETTEKPVE